MKTKITTTTTVMIAGINPDDKLQFYCSQKFTQLSVDIEKNTMCSCCAADVSNVPVKWLRDHPGQLFNTIELRDERTLMLSGTPVTSCARSCWEPERTNQVSRRVKSGSQQLTHTDLSGSLEHLTIHLTSDCNLTCVYCCKQYSSAWRNDIDVHGGYPVTDPTGRFTLNTHDMLRKKLSQRELSHVDSRNTTLTEVCSSMLSPTLKSVEISGGEPFLNNHLGYLIQHVPNSVRLKIKTGMGVNNSRFRAEISKLTSVPNLTISISAECVGDMYETVRYGNTWENFVDNLAVLKELGIHYEFGMTLSNLTIFGLMDFLSFINGARYTFSICTEPSFLSLKVLDDESKRLVNSREYPTDIARVISAACAVSPGENERDSLSKYLREYCLRRNLDLGMYPTSFKEWIK